MSDFGSVTKTSRIKNYNFMPPRSLILLFFCTATTLDAFVPLVDGGSKMPVLYKGWFDDQIAKQASTAIAKAVGAGKVFASCSMPSVLLVIISRRISHIGLVSFVFRIPEKD